MNIERNKLYKAIISALLLSLTAGTAFAAPTDGTGTNSVVLNNGTAGGSNSIVGGDTSNNAEGSNSAIIGGRQGSIKSSGTNSVILGGGYPSPNVIEGTESVILGGFGNTIEGSGTNTAAIIAGRRHTVKADDGVIIGGGESGAGGSLIDTGGENSVIAAGYGHRANGLNTGIIGGQNNKTESGNNTGFLAGHHNTITHGESVILGGSNNKIKQENSAILAGGYNEITGSYSIVSGRSNTTSGSKSVVLGGNGHISSGQNSAIIAGNENGTTAKDSVVFGGWNNKITAGEKNFILGGKNNRVSATLSGAIGGDGNNISGSKSYAIGGGNTVASTIDYILGEGNDISGSHNYIIGSGNTSTQEKVYILGSNVNASGKTRAVVLGDGSTAVTDAVSVGTEAAPRNIKHVKDGLISDTSLDAINGSQVTTLKEKAGTVDETYVVVNRKASEENGAAPHTNGHRKYYEIGLTQEATQAITDAKTHQQEIPTIKSDIANLKTNKLEASNFTGDLISDGTITVENGTDKLLGDVTIKVADGAITAAKLAPAVNDTINGKLNKADLSVITSSDLTVSNNGDLKAGPVNLTIADGAINVNNLGQDVQNLITQASNPPSNNINDIAPDSTTAVTGGVINQYLIDNFYDINKVDDLLKQKVDKSSMNHNLTSNTITVVNGNGQFYKDFQIEVTDGSLTKNKLHKDVQDEIDSKISASDINNITSSTLTITGGGTNNEGNVAKGIVNIEVKNGSITTDKLDQNFVNNVNNKISKADLEGSNTVTLTEKDGKTVFSVQDGSIGATQLDKPTNDTLARVGAGTVTSGDENTITGNVAFDAIKHAKTIVDKKGDYITLDKTESDDVEPNKYTVGLDLAKVKEDLATGNITGEGITIEGGDKSTFKDVKLSIADNAITTNKVADNAITEDKIADEAVKKFTEKSRETVVAGSDALKVQPSGAKDNQEFRIDLSDKTKTTLKQVATNKTDIANNKTEIAKKVNTDDMNGVLDSKTITVTGDGASRLLDDIQLEVNVDGKSIVVDEITGALKAVIPEFVDTNTQNTSTAGKNITLVETTNADGTINYEIATKDNVEFNTVSSGNVTVNNDLTVTPNANIDMGGNQIHNVKAGTSPRDAVNVSQLKELDKKFNAGLSNLGDKAESGAAAANALAMLGHARDTGESAVSAGVGFYHDKVALAVGVSAWSDNGHWLLKGALTQGVSSGGELGGGASATYNFE
ncbi:MAG: YadA-like family protein [Gammaproteobacteria bacterium]|nr:YadA-like family protein [Gammaproteobacteria bacterium]